MEYELKTLQIKEPIPMTLKIPEQNNDDSVVLPMRGDAKGDMPAAKKGGLSHSFKPRHLLWRRILLFCVGPPMGHHFNHNRFAGHSCVGARGVVWWLT